MTRETLDRKLKTLLDETATMSSLVEIALLDAVEALVHHDLKLARRVYQGDAAINARRFDLETDIIVTIATVQPVMATDLRRIASILEVVAELERMGDYAKGIAKVTLITGETPPISPPEAIPQMVTIAAGMLQRAVAAFIHEDADAAQAIPAEDARVDQLYDQVYRQLVQIMFADQATIDAANHMMWVAHNLERVADRVTNICERTVYVTTGKLMEFDLPRSP
jgi:phosphate transport system protein